MNVAKHLPEELGLQVRPQRRRGGAGMQNRHSEARSRGRVRRAYGCPYSIHLPSGKLWRTRSRMDGWMEDSFSEGRKEGMPDHSSKTEGTGGTFSLADLC